MSSVYPIKGRAAKMGGLEELYIHIPFCSRKCFYCDFASRATRNDSPLIASYIDALIHEVQLLAKAGILAHTHTIYIGGGTPSLAGPELVRLVEALKRCCLYVEEFSCEANPESLSKDLADKLIDAGITRFSIGVQSFDDTELALLGRQHKAQEAYDIIFYLTSTHPQVAVSCDLMCAIPEQTDASWQQTLEKAMQTGVHHISVYPLAIEPNTVFDRKYPTTPEFNTPEVQAYRMQQAADFLRAHGFVRYETASYAREGYCCRHNIGYWSGATYLGLGTQASSMFSHDLYAALTDVFPQLPQAGSEICRVRITQTDSPSAYAQAKLLSNYHFDLEFLDIYQATAEDVMLAARMPDGLSEACIQWGQAVFGARFDAACDKAAAEGLIVYDAQGGFSITERGWLLGNELFSIMWSLADGEVICSHC